MRKAISNIMSIILSIFVVLTSFPSNGSYVANAQSHVKEIINDDGVLLHKEANLVEGTLNEWEVDLKLQFDAAEIRHDIVLIIDTSGSMNEYDRMINAKDAAKKFVDAVLADEYKNINRVSLINYSNGPIIRSEFTNDRTTLARQINNLNADGGTFTQAAVKYGRDMLDLSDADKKSIVLLTDGAPSFGYDLSSTGKTKYQSLPQIKDSSLSLGNFDVYQQGNSWVYLENSFTSNGRNRVKLVDNLESNFKESDFNYINSFGGNGAEALKISTMSDYNNYYFLNLYATSEAEATFAKNRGHDFYTVGLGLGNDKSALNMLFNMASDENKYFNVDDMDNKLNDIFLKIAQDLNFPFKDMKFNDVMGNSVDYIDGLEAVTGSTENFNFDNEEYSLNAILNEDNFHYNQETKKYELHIKYRVRTNDEAINELMNGNSEILTNEAATFTYTKRKDNVPVESEFPKPMVKPTIFAVTKELFDEDGNILSLLDNSMQRSYNYSITTEHSELSGIITHDRQLEYHVLNDHTDYTINEVSITNDDINKYDVTYVLENEGVTTENIDGKFTLQPESGLNVLSIQNRPNKEYVFEDYVLKKHVVDSNSNNYAEYNEILSYTIQLSNTSEDAFVRDVFIQDNLEELNDYVADSYAGPVTVKRNGELTDEKVTISELISGFNTYLGEKEVLELSFELSVIDYGVTLPDTLDNTVTSTINGTSKTASATIDTKVPNIEAYKSVVDENENNIAEPGEELTYTIDIKNIGEVVHDKLFIQDTLSDLKDHVENLDDVEFMMNDVSYPISKLMEGFYESNIQPQDTVQIVFTVKLNSTLNTTLVNWISNIATIDNQSPYTDIETGSPIITAEKQVIDENRNNLAEPGENLTYKIVVENKGNVEKKNVVVQDSLENIISEIDTNTLDDPELVEVHNGNEVSKYTINELRGGINVDLDKFSDITVLFTVKVKEDFNADRVPKLINTAKVDNLEVSASINTAMAKLSSNKEVFDENNDGYAEANEKLTYIITVENNGNADKNNLFIQDEIKDLLLHTDAASRLDDSIVSVDVAGQQTFTTLRSLKDGFYVTIPANSIVLLSFEVNVNEDINTSKVTKISNVALVGDETPGTTIDTGKPEIKVKKTVSDENRDRRAEASEKLTYTITVENTGTVKKKDLLIQDTLSELINHINPIDEENILVNGKSRPLTDLINGFTVDIDAGDSIIVTFTVTVKDDFNANLVQELKNIATVGDQNPEVKIPTGEAVITATKSVSDSNGNNIAEANEQLDYVITISNTGTVEKRGLEVQDTLESVLPYVKNIDDVDMIINGASRPLTDLISGFQIDIPSGSTIEIIFSVVVKEDIDFEVVKEISNVAIVGDEKPEITIPTGKPNIVASKNVIDETGDGRAEAGEYLHYTLTVFNDSDVADNNLLIKDDLSDLIEHIDSITDVNMTVNGKEEPLQNLVNGFETKIDAHEQIIITFSVRIKDDFDASLKDKFENIAVVGPLTPTIDIPTGQAVINAVKSVKDSNGDHLAEAGEQLNYTITVTNNGNVKKDTITVQDDLLHIIDYVEDTSTSIVQYGDKTAPLQTLMEGHTISLDAGETMNITFTVTLRSDFNASETPNLINIGLVDNEPVEASINTGEPLISATKTVVDKNENTFAEAGEDLTYTITVKNYGNVAKKNLLIQDDLKDLIDHIDNIDQSIVSFKGQNRPLKDLVEGFEINIDAQEEIKFIFTVTVKEDFDAQKHTKLSNLVTVGNEEPKVEIPTGTPIISANKAVVDENGDGFAEAGERLDYSITIKNTGLVKKEGLFIQDDLADLLEHINDIENSILNINGESQPLQNLVDGFELDIEANETIIIQFSVTVRSDFEANDVVELSNVATVGELHPGININTGKPVIRSFKEVRDADNDGYAEAGEQLNYKITISNTGNVTQRGLKVQDSLSELIDHIEKIDDVKMLINGVKQPLTKLVNGFEIDVKAGEKIIVEFAVTVKEDFDALKHPKLTNIATIGVENPTIDIPAGTPVIAANKSVIDENGDGYAEAGERLDYSIKITNAGDVDAEELFVQDTLEYLLPHIDSIEDTVLLVNDEKKMVSDLVEGFTILVPAHEEVSLNFSVTLREDFDASSVKSISNIATVGDEDPEVKIPTGKAIIVSNKNVIDENGDGFAEAGERLDYTISIKNNGDVEKVNLFVQDDLKDLIDYIEDISSSIVHVDGEIRSLEDLVDGFNINVQAHSEFEIKFSVTVKEDFDASAVKTLLNMATIGEETPSVVIPSGQANIISRKEVIDDNNDGFVEAGEKLHYTITINNTGEVKKTGLFVQDKLKDSIGHIDNISSAVVSVNGKQMRLKDLMSGFYLDVEAGEQVVIKFTISVKEDFDASEVKTLSNLATIGNDEPQVTIPSGRAIIVSDKLVVDENNDGYAEANELLTYLITIKNKGNVRKDKLFVQDNLKFIQQYINDISTTLVLVNDIERPLVDLIEGFYIDVEPGEQIEIMFTVKVNEDFDSNTVTTLMNLATVGDEEPSVKIPTGVSNIIASKHVADQSRDHLVEAKERLDYTIKISNIGTVKDEEVFVQDKLEGLLPYIDDIEGTSVYVGTDTFELKQLIDGITISLDAGEQVDLTFSVNVRNDFNPAEVASLDNIAIVKDKTVEATILVKQEQPDDKVPSIPNKENPKKETPSTGIQNISSTYVVLIISAAIILATLLRLKNEEA